jgi:hypothetical protein
VTEQLLVPGHTLVGEGAPHMWNGRRYEVIHARGFGTAGEGKALCSCGETSRVLKTGAARKAWHREHKLIVARMTDGEWTPQRIEAAIEAVYPFVQVGTSVTAEGVQVSMPFDDLCSFIEWICGSMSEQDLTGFVKEELARHLELKAATADATAQITGRRKTAK